MKTSDDTVIVAADGGGTGSRAAAGTLGDGMLAQAAGGAGNVHSDFDGAVANLTKAITQALQEAGLGDTPLENITAHLGVAGAHTEVEMATVARALPYGASHVTGDRATSVRGVLGESDGYVVALGTGTIIARQDALEMRTVSGWGFDLSDNASGSWLGHQALRRAVMAEDGFCDHTDLTRTILKELGGLVPAVHFSSDATPGDYAPFARPVITAAREGDEIALDLMRDGAAFLRKGLETLGFQPGDMLALAGGVGPHYAPYLPPEMTENLVQPKGTALDGAFAMACQAARAAGK